MLLHEILEDAGVGGETGDGNSEVVVYAGNLFLIGREFFWTALWVVAGMLETSITFREEDRRERTLSATRTACVLLTRPTETDPCFSASNAYST